MLDNLGYTLYLIFNDLRAPTFANSAISSKSLFTAAAERTFIVSAISVLVARTGIGRALVYI